MTRWHWRPRAPLRIPSSPSSWERSSTRPPLTTGRLRWEVKSQVAQTRHHQGTLMEGSFWKPSIHINNAEVSIVTNNYRCEDYWWLNKQLSCVTFGDCHCFECEQEEVGQRGQGWGSEKRDSAYIPPFPPPQFNAPGPTDWKHICFCLIISQIIIIQNSQNVQSRCKKA